MNVKTIEMGVLGENETPCYDASDNPTSCCPRFNPAGWSDRQLHFKDKLFVRAKTRSVMHVPVNMGRVFARTMQAIDNAGAQDLEQAIVLSHELSPWRAEHLFAVTNDVPGQEMVRLSGHFRTKVFEGSYSNVRHWCKELTQLVDEADGQPDTFFFYTTCPKCAQAYGKNYVVGLVSTDAKL